MCRYEVVELACDPGSVPAARHAVRATCQAWGVPEPAADDATLVVSELATNAVVHGHSALEVHLGWSAAGLDIAVRDRGLGVPRPASVPPLSQHGRGLRIVSDLATDWGTQPDQTGKVVWCRLGCPVPEPARCACGPGAPAGPPPARDVGAVPAADQLRLAVRRWIRDGSWCGLIAALPAAPGSGQPADTAAVLAALGRLPQPPPGHVGPVHVSVELDATAVSGRDPAGRILAARARASVGRSTPVALAVAVPEGLAARDTVRCAALLDRLRAAGVVTEVSALTGSQLPPAALQRLGPDTVRISAVTPLERRGLLVGLARSVVRRPAGSPAVPDVVIDGVLDLHEVTQWAGVGARAVTGPVCGGWVPPGQLAALLSSRPRWSVPGATASPSDRVPHAADPAEHALTATRALLRCRDVGAVADLLRRVTERLGGRLAGPEQVSGDVALPLDLSLGVGPPVVPVHAGDPLVQLRLQAVLPALVEDARALLARGLPAARAPAEPAGGRVAP